MKKIKIKSIFIEYILNLTAILFLLISCQEESKDISNIFSKQVFVKGKTLINSSMLYDPWSISIKDSLIFIGNYEGEPLLELYNTKGQLLKKTLKKGRGPNEVVAIGKIQPNFLYNEFYVSDLLGKKILRFYLDSLLKDNNYVADILIDFNSEKFNKGLIEKVLVHNNFFIGLSSSIEGRVALLDKNGNPIKYFLSYPPKKVDERLNDDVNARLYSSGFAISPDGKHLGIVTYMADIINLLYVTSSNIDSVWSYQNRLPNDIFIMQNGNYIQHFFTKKSRMGYLDAAATDNYFYALYSGKQMSDTNSYYANVVRKISWDGKDRYEYVLDKPVKRIAVSKDDKILYTISLGEGRVPEIVYFNL